MIEIGAKTAFLRLCTKNKQNLRQGAQMGACRRYVVDSLDICCPSKAAEVGAHCYCFYSCSRTSHGGCRPIWLRIDSKAIAAAIFSMLSS
jgi:hypothetical protein